MRRVEEEPQHERAPRLRPVRVNGQGAPLGRGKGVVMGNSGPGPGGARSATEAFEFNALEALAWHWGEAYEITVAGGLWRAWRRDRIGGVLEGGTPEELRQAILEDYLTRPVARP